MKKLYFIPKEHGPFEQLDIVFCFISKNYKYPSEIVLSSTGLQSGTLLKIPEKKLWPQRVSQPHCNHMLYFPMRTILQQIRSFDEPASKEILDRLIQGADFFTDEETQLLAKERIMGEHSEEYLLGLVSGYLHAVDIFQHDTDPVQFILNAKGAAAEIAKILLERE